MAAVRGDSRIKYPFYGPAQQRREMEASVPAGEAPAAAGARAGVTPARIWLHNALGSNLILCTVSMLASLKIALTS